MKGEISRKARLELAVWGAVFTRQLEQLRNGLHRTSQPGQDASHAIHGTLLAGAEPALHVL